MDRAVVAAVAKMYRPGPSTRKVQAVAQRLGIERLSKDQVSAICADLDAEVEELRTRPLGDARMPYLWLDATYVKCRRDGRVASTAVVTAIGCDEAGWRHVLGVGVVDTESYESWLGFTRGRARPGRARRGAGGERRARGPQAGHTGDLPGGGVAALRRAPHA